MKYTLLIVDDEPNMVRALVRLFRSDTIDILTAQNGQEALEIIKQQPVHVLLTDNMMPVMTGLELVKRTNGCSPDTVRIVLTGQSDMETVLAAVNEGEVFRFVLKPWNDIELKASVLIALGHRRLIEDNKRLIKELKEKCQLLDKLQEKDPGLYNELHNLIHAMY